MPPENDPGSGPPSLSRRFELLLDLRGELLPECWDSWVVFDRERLRQEAVQLLEAASAAAQASGQLHLALLLALNAVECDPLRESANMLVVRMHMVNGDLSGAVRRARFYARLLSEEIGVGPPQPLADLLSSHHRTTQGEDATRTAVLTLR